MKTGTQVVFISLLRIPLPHPPLFLFTTCVAHTYTYICLCAWPEACVRATGAIASGSGSSAAK